GCSNLLVLSDGTLVAPYSVVDKSDPENANVGKGVGKGIEQRPWAVGPGRSVLCVLRSVDGGRSFERGARISKWDRSGVACFTVSPQRADGKQRLYAAWSDIRGERHHVLLSYSSDKGLTWSKPAVVSDDTGAREKDVDAFLPAIAVNKNGVVGVSWYDTRELPSGRTGWDVRFRATLDEAKTWLPSVRVSEKSSVFKGGSGPLGDTAGLAADAEGVFHVLWVDHRTGVQQAWTAEVSVGTKKSPDHQARADAASWDFSPDAASLKKSITGFPKPYQVEPSPDDVGNATITITKEGKALYRWSGHTASVFLAAADVLYYADYSRDATGCRLIAVDLKNGKELWKTRLKGLGPIRHSRYSNQVNLRLEDMAMLRITSLESAGGYLEFVDRRTGKTVGHRVFSSKERE
ncbi:MAG TPA: sialidase family protein, partial [Gemmataceae bacterium]|nr:sialidase family protein [Gemmataceae bacterium]